MKSSVIGNSLPTFPKISQPARRSFPGSRSFLPLHSAKTLPSFKPIAAQTSADLSGFFNCKSHSSMAEPVPAKGKGKLQVFESEDDLSDSMAKYVAGLSEKFIRERGAFTLVVSGGSLFKSLGKLYESPYFDSIGWENWHVFWVDERVVPKDHPDSNYKLAYDALLSKGERAGNGVIRNKTERWGVQGTNKTGVLLLDLRRVSLLQIAEHLSSQYQLISTATGNISNLMFQQQGIYTVMMVEPA